MEPLVRRTQRAIPGVARGLGCKAQGDTQRAVQGMHPAAARDRQAVPAHCALRLGPGVCGHPVRRDRPQIRMLASPVGVDRNGDHLALRAGPWVPMPHRVARIKQRARYLRRLARCTKGSRRNEKAKLRVAEVARAMRNVMTRWCYPTSRYLTDVHDIVCTNDLHMQGMDPERSWLPSKAWHECGTATQIETIGGYIRTHTAQCRQEWVS